MKAMILAAGRGSRMMPLTKNTPKSLLTINGISLIEQNINRLKSANICDIVINTAYLGDKIEQHLGNGKQLGVDITYSHEAPGGLETAGGIINALPLLGDEPFIVINADVLCHYNLAKLTKLTPSRLAHLVLANNPDYHPEGDFYLNKNQVSLTPQDKTPKYTYTGIGLYHPDFFMGYTNQYQPLCPLLKAAIAKNALSGELFSGFWCDVGTPERLAQLNKQ